MRVASKVPYQVAEAGQTVEKMFTVGNYRVAFVVAGIMCLAAAVVVQLIRAPKRA